MATIRDIVIGSVWIRTQAHSCGCSSCRSEYRIESINTDAGVVQMALFKAYDLNAAKREYANVDGILRNWILVKPGVREKSGFGSFVTRIES